MLHRLSLSRVAAFLGLSCIRVNLNDLERKNRTNEKKNHAYRLILGFCHGGVVVPPAAELPPDAFFLFLWLGCRIGFWVSVDRMTVGSITWAIGAVHSNPGGIEIWLFMRAGIDVGRSICLAHGSPT